MLRPDHSRVPPVDPAACTADAPMWCDGGGLRGRAGRYTTGARGDDSSAPENPGEAHAVEGLVKKAYIIHGSWPEIKLER